jgi:hypothetical protein
VITRSKLSSLTDVQLQEKVTVETGKILALILAVPKSAQLRNEALSVLEQVLSQLGEIKKQNLLVPFKDEISKSLNDVIKDVSSEAATKITARNLRTSLEGMLSQGPVNMETD